MIKREKRRTRPDRMQPAEFEAICESIYGPYWRRPASRALGRDAKMMHRYATGESVVPTDVAEHLLRIAEIGHTGDVIKRVIMKVTTSRGQSPDRIRTSAAEGSRACRRDRWRVAPAKIDRPGGLKMDRKQESARRMRVVIYARFSSDQQRDASIEDQLRICRARIDREGWTFQNAYTDHAISGASRMRPGYQKLLKDARAGAFDIVIAEALDRLSRDQEDTAALYKALTFSDVKLITLAEGEISELQVGIKGTMNSLFLKDLAQKTRRGLEGRVRQGKSGGGISYGYDVVTEHDTRGEPLRGGRAINLDEAEVVKRIFREYADGLSPQKIAKRLNQEHIAGPGGRPWGNTTIRGHAERGTGILHNELYVGRLVWNRLRYLKGPRTGKRISRINPPEAWVITEVPELRIIDDDLWNSAKERLQAKRDSPAVVKARSTSSG